MYQAQNDSLTCGPGVHHFARKLLIVPATDEYRHAPNIKGEN